MRYSAVVLSALVMSASLCVAQSGFSTQTYAGVLPASSDNTKLLVGDLNGDGRPDLVSYGSRNGASTVSGNVFLNNGSGGFLAPVALPGSGQLASAKLGDMNGDGYPDIVGCMNVGSGQTQAVSVTVYLNNGNGTFRALPAQTGNGQCSALTLGDVDHNGRLDVVTAGHTPGQYDPGGTFFPGNTNFIDVFRNDGTGVLSLRETGGGTLDDSATSSVYSNCGLIDVVGGDFEQNGNFNLVLTTRCEPSGQTPSFYPSTTFYQRENFDPNNGGDYSTVATHIQSAHEIYMHGKAVDVNGDGKLDVLFDGKTDPYTGDVTYLQNTGSGTFAFSRQFNAAYVFGVAVADFTNDGIKDMATSYVENASSTQPQGPPMITITSGPQFNDVQDFATGTSSQIAGDVVTGDFNGDGKADLATLVYDTTTGATSLKVYTNTQGGTAACSAPPTVNTNTICSPVRGATLNSPVTVDAASNVTGFTLNRLYLDNKAVYEVASQQVNTQVTAAFGAHTLVLVSYNNAGKAFTSSTSFTIGSSTGNGCIPSAPGVTICSPTNGSTVSPPVSITAGARAQSGNITAMRVYVDNIDRGTVSHSPSTPTFQFTASGYDFGGGTHHLVVVGYESTGGSVTSSLYFSEPSGPCMAPTGGTSLKLCSPTSGSTVASPFTVSANAYTQSGYIAAMRIYVDNTAVALINNSQKSQSFTINQSVSASSGTHALVVVAYPSGGGSLSSEENVTLK